MKKIYNIQASKNLKDIQYFTFWGSKKDLLLQVKSLSDAGYTEISCIVVSES